jgi:hypothetical protein
MTELFASLDTHLPRHHPRASDLLWRKRLGLEQSGLFVHPRATISSLSQYREFCRDMRTPYIDTLFANFRHISLFKQLQIGAKSTCYIGGWDGKFYTLSGPKLSASIVNAHHPAPSYNSPLRTRDRTECYPTGSISKSAHEGAVNHRRALDIP